MKKEERWKQELEQYKTDLAYLRKALETTQQETPDDTQRQLLYGGMMQGFGAAVFRAASLMNTYMQSLGQGRNKSLKHILAKAFKMGLVTHKRWMEVEDDLRSVYDVENLQEAQKMEKKIRRVYLPLLTRFEEQMELKAQPTLFG